MTNEQAMELYDKIKYTLAETDRRKREGTDAYPEAYGRLSATLEGLLEAWPAEDRGKLGAIPLSELPF